MTLEALANIVFATSSLTVLVGSLHLLGAYTRLWSLAHEGAGFLVALSIFSYGVDVFSAGVLVVFAGALCGAVLGVAFGGARSNQLLLATLCFLLATREIGLARAEFFPASVGAAGLLIEAPVSTFLALALACFLVVLVVIAAHFIGKPGVSSRAQLIGRSVVIADTLGIRSRLLTLFLWVATIVIASLSVTLRVAHTGVGSANPILLDSAILAVGIAMYGRTMSTLRIMLHASAIGLIGEFLAFQTGGAARQLFFGLTLLCIVLLKGRSRAQVQFL